MPQCGSTKLTKIPGLKKQHCGGDDWCLECGRIFDIEKIKKNIQRLNVS
jgi:hypothetical protein